MDDEDRAALLIFGGFIALIVAIAVILTASHEIMADGAAKRCAEYNYNCEDKE